MKDYLLRRTVKFILEEATRFEAGELFKTSWELWGTGMLRLDLSLDVTLHIWDMRFRDPAVTLAHDHPWHFDSLVVSGRLMNQRFWCYDPMTPTLLPNEVISIAAVPYTRQRIVCGESGCKLEDPQYVQLVEQRVQVFSAGETYHQQNNEIHETLADDGTVTLCRRTFDPTADRNSANVYIPKGEEFGSAEPRLATPEEIRVITNQALSIWSDAFDGK